MRFILGSFFTKTQKNIEIFVKIFKGESRVLVERILPPPLPSHPSPLLGLSSSPSSCCVYSVEISSPLFPGNLEIPDVHMRPHEKQLLDGNITLHEHSSSAASAEFWQLRGLREPLDVFTQCLQRPMCVNHCVGGPHPPRFPHSPLPSPPPLASPF